MSTLYRVTWFTCQLHIQFYTVFLVSACSLCLSTSGSYTAHTPLKLLSRFWLVTDACISCDCSDGGRDSRFCCYLSSVRRHKPNKRTLLQESTVLILKFSFLVRLIMSMFASLPKVILKFLSQYLVQKERFSLQNTRWLFWTNLNTKMPCIRRVIPTTF